MSEALSIADLFVDVKFNPDNANLKNALGDVKGKFEQVANSINGIAGKINGIASGVKGLFALQAFSAVAGVANRIAGSIMGASAEAAQLQKMALRTGKSVEELQKRQGKRIILSKEEVADLAKINNFFSDIGNMANKVIVGIARKFAPYMDKAREFLQGDQFKGMMDKIMGMVDAVWGMVEPIIKELPDMFGGAFDFVMDFLKSLMPIVKPVMEIVKVLFKAVMNVVKMLMPIVISITNSVKMLLNSVSSFLKTGVLDTILKLANAILKPVKAVFYILEEIFAIFDDSVDGYFEQSVGFKDIADKIKAGRDWLMNFFEKILEVAGGIFDNLYTYIEVAFGKAKEALLWIWKKLVAIGDKVGGFIDKIIPDALKPEIDMTPTKERKATAKALKDDSDSLQEKIDKPETPIASVAKQATGYIADVNKGSEKVNRDVAKASPPKITNNSPTTNNTENKNSTVNNNAKNSTVNNIDNNNSKPTTNNTTNNTEKTTNNTTNNTEKTTNNRTTNITVNINGSAASPKEIKKAVEQGVFDAEKFSNMR